VDSTVSVVSNATVQCMQQCKDCPYQNILPGSRGERILILLGKLLDANAEVINYRKSFIFHDACHTER
jgi:hypothetical protein